MSPRSLVAIGIPAALVLSSCTNQDTVGAQENAPVNLTERGMALVSGASNAITKAVAKAEELEYNLTELRVEIHETEAGGWTVQFNPATKQQRGGNLTVHIDKDGEVENVQRWR